MKFVEVTNPTTGATTTVPESRLRHITDKGWRVTEPADVVDVSGNVDDVLAAVGDDPALAQAALDAEKADRNRSTLVNQLSGIVNNTQED